MAHRLPLAIEGKRPGQGSRCRTVVLNPTQQAAGRQAGYSPWLKHHSNLVSGKPRTPALASDLERTSPPAACSSRSAVLSGDTTETGAAIAESAAPRSGKPTSESPRAGESPVSGYALLAELGRGGTSIVYLAREDAPRRCVALKCMRPEAAADPNKRARFRTEAQVLARLDHPHIVRLHAAGERPAGPHLALEFVDGGSLESYLAGGLPPLDQAARLVETLARAVAYIRRLGLVHGDLKPGNILLQMDGHTMPIEQQGVTLSRPKRPNLLLAVPKIADFELAQPLAGETTAGGQKGIQGTPGYMAPEQAQGGGKGIGPAADVYALGAILYRLLTGRPPFREKTARATLDRVLAEEPVTPCSLNSQLPTALEMICLRCLERDPQRRYPRADALAQDLQRYLIGVEAERGQPGTYPARVRPAA